MSKISDYKNKYFSFLGDSITTFYRYSTPKEAAFYDDYKSAACKIFDVSDTWWGAVLERLDAKLLVNDSFSGTTVCYSPQYLVESYGCSDARTSSLSKNGVTPDVIVVFMGINDWGAGCAVKESDNINAKSELQIFSVAYDRLVEKLQNNYPDAEIWCLTLFRGSIIDGKRRDFALNGKNTDIREYSEAIRRCADKRGCRIIDLCNDCDYVDTIDGFHPDKNGMAKIADCVMSSLGDFVV